MISYIIILWVIHVTYKMYTLHLKWPGLDYYFSMDNIINPAAECCITAGSHAFPRLQTNTHIIMVLLVVYRVSIISV